MTALKAWESFYVIVGSSAGALTGLQFVVMTLIAELVSDGRVKSNPMQIAAFGSPTIVHFCVVLFASAALSAPWPSPLIAGRALVACGAAGLVYAAIVLRRTRRQTGYVLVLEDWLWHVIAPTVSYALVLAAGLRLEDAPEPALFALAAAMLLHLYTGIHNSWDTVIYLVAERLPRRKR